MLSQQLAEIKHVFNLLFQLLFIWSNKNVFMVLVLVNNNIPGD